MIGITGSYNCDNNFLEKIKDPFLNFNSKNFKNLNININYTDNDINGTFYKIDKSNFCLVLGDIFDDRVMENKISKSLLVYKIYKSKGINEILKINGNFLFIISDKKNFYIGKSDNSVIPLFYNFKKNKLSFSYDLTQTIKIAKNDIKFNYANVFTPILCGGIHLDNSTFFKNYFKLESGTFISIKKNKFNLSNFKYFSFIEKKDMGSDYYITHTKSILEDSIKKRIKKFNKIKLGLSGGLDSRIIFGIIKNLEINLETFTYGTGNFIENKIASDLAKINRNKHFFYNIKKNEYLINSDKVLINSSGILTTNMSPQINVYKKLKEKNSSLIFGTFLDFLIGNSAYSEKIYNIKNLNSLKNLYIKDYLFKYSKTEFLKLFQVKKCGQNIYDEIVYKVFSSLENINYDNIPNLNNSFFFTNRGKRWHNQTLISSSFYNQLIIPSYDNRFLNFVSSIPSKYKKNDFLRISLMQRLDKKINNIILNKSLLPANTDPKTSNQAILNQNKRLSFLRKKWAKNNYLKKYSTSYFFDANFSEWITKEKKFQNFLYERLFNNSLFKNFLNMEHLEKIFNKQLMGKDDNFKLLIFICDYQTYIKKIKKKFNKIFQCNHL